MVKVKHSDGTVTEAVGYLDLGGLLIPRARLAKELPDIARFERCLVTARYISEYSAFPPGWNPTDGGINDVALTLGEMDELELKTAEALELY
jgi:hypothetical protein